MNASFHLDDNPKPLLIEELAHAELVYDIFAETPRKEGKALIFTKRQMELSAAAMSRMGRGPWWPAQAMPRNGKPFMATDGVQRFEVCYMIKTNTFDVTSVMPKLPSKIVGWQLYPELIGLGEFQ